MKKKKLQSILQLIQSFNSSTHQKIPQPKIKKISYPTPFLIGLMVVIDTVCNFLSNLTPNPFPCREGEQESKPLSLQGRGLERGFKNKFYIALIVLFLALGVGNLTPTNLLSIQPAIAQRISPGEIWQQVYQQFPDLPKENQYINKETGKVAENNTLASRLIRYHIYVKERAPNYRLDWKLTLADYLGANEIIYDSTYPGNESLRQNPLEGDRIAIASLTRPQRNTLVQVLTNIFNSNSQNIPSK